MNELILFIETAGLAWWGGLLLICVAASAMLIFDRPAAVISARVPEREPLLELHHDEEDEEDRKAA